MKKIWFILMILVGTNLFANSSSLITGLIIGLASGSSTARMSFTQQKTFQYRLNDGTIFIWSESMPNTLYRYSGDVEETFICKHSEKLFTRTAKINIISIVEGKKKYTVFSFDSDGIQVGTEYVSDKAETYSTIKIVEIILLIACILGVIFLFVILLYRFSGDEDEDDEVAEEDEE